MAEEVAKGVGLGGVLGAVTGDKGHSGSRHGGHHGRDRRSHGRSRRYSSSSRSSSRGRGGIPNHKIAQAARAALMAGAAEAFKVRSAPGQWKGEKGQRVATAALGAAGMEGLIENKSKKNDKRHLAEAVVGGLVANRVANGNKEEDLGSKHDKSRTRSHSHSHHKSRSHSHRHRDRSSSRSSSSSSGSGSDSGGGGLGKAAKGAAGAAAIGTAGKAIYDRVRSRSRGRSASRDSYSSRSGSDSGSGGGLGKKVKGAGGAGALAAAGKSLFNRVRSKSRGRRSPSASSDDGYVPSRDRRYQGKNRGYGGGGTSGAMVPMVPVVPMRQPIDYEKAPEDDEKREECGDSESTSDMETQCKKLKSKELLTAGLATIATAHAAHGVYESFGQAQKRHKLLAEGEITPEEARKRKTKAFIQDASAIGIAAVGIKSAYGEWKDMQEKRKCLHDLEKKREERRKRREERHGRQSLQQQPTNGMPPYNAAPNAAPYPAYVAGPVPAPVIVKGSGPPPGAPPSPVAYKAAGPRPGPPPPDRLYPDPYAYPVNDLPPPPLGTAPAR